MVDAIRAQIKCSNITVTTSATAMPTTSLSGRVTMAVRNNGAAVIYLGHAAVSTANGYPLAAGAEIGLDVGPQVIIYGIVATGTVDVRILEGA